MTGTERVGLRRPAEVDPAVMAAIVIAVDLSWPRPTAAPPAPAGNDGWRFSGRWWNQPVPLRRERPGGGY